MEKETTCTVATEIKFSGRAHLRHDLPSFQTNLVAMNNEHCSNNYIGVKFRYKRCIFFATKALCCTIWLLHVFHKSNTKWAKTPM